MKIDPQVFSLLKKIREYHLANEDRAADLKGAFKEPKEDSDKENKENEEDTNEYTKAASKALKVFLASEEDGIHLALSFFNFYYIWKLYINELNQVGLGEMAESHEEALNRYFSDVLAKIKFEEIEPAISMNTRLEYPDKVDFFLYEENPFLKWHRIFCDAHALVELYLENDPEGAVEAAGCVYQALLEDVKKSAENNNNGREIVPVFGSNAEEKKTFNQLAAAYLNEKNIRLNTVVCPFVKANRLLLDDEKNIERELEKLKATLKEKHDSFEKSDNPYKAMYAKMHAKKVKIDNRVSGDENVLKEKLTDTLELCEEVVTLGKLSSFEDVVVVPRSENDKEYKDYLKKMKALNQKVWGKDVNEYEVPELPSCKYNRYAKEFISDLSPTKTKNGREGTSQANQILKDEARRCLKIAKQLEYTYSLNKGSHS